MAANGGNNQDDFVVGLNVDISKVILGLEQAIKKAAILEAQVKQAAGALSSIANVKVTGNGSAVASMMPIPKAPRATKASTTTAGTTTSFAGGKVEIKSPALTAISRQLGGIKDVLSKIELKIGMLAPGSKFAEEKVLGLLGASGDISSLSKTIENAGKSLRQRAAGAAIRVGSDEGSNDKPKKVIVENPSMRRAHLNAFRPKNLSGSQLAAIISNSNEDDFVDSLYAKRAQDEIDRRKKQGITGSVSERTRALKLARQGEFSRHDLRGMGTSQLGGVLSDMKQNPVADSIQSSQIDKIQKELERRQRQEIASKYAIAKEAKKATEEEDRAKKLSLKQQYYYKQEQAQQLKAIQAAEVAAYAADEKITAARIKQNNRKTASEVAAHAENNRINAVNKKQAIQRQVKEGFARHKELEAQNGNPGEGAVENVFRRAVLFGAVSAVIFKAVDAGRQFIGTMITMDKQMADLRKTLSGTDSDFRKLVDSAITIARTYKGSTQEVLDAIEIFSSQFKNAADLSSLAKSAVLFANISGQTLKESAETMTSAIQQYDLTATQALEVTDKWANVSANAAVSAGDLGDAIGAAGSAAKTAGLSMDQLNAMVAVVATATGKSGKEIGNSFSRIFERATNPENAFEIYKQFGVSVKDLTGEFRPFGDVLGDVSQKWTMMSDTQKKQLAILFAGARQYNVFIALMDNYRRTVELTAISHNSLGAAQRQNERIGDTFVKKIQLLSNEFDVLARVSGDKVIPAMGGVVDIMTHLMRLFNDASSSVKTFGLALAAVLGANVAGSYLFKFVATEKNVASGGFKVRNGMGRFIEGAGQDALNPLTGGVNLISGLGRSVLNGNAKKALISGISGGVGSLASGATMAGLGAFAVGLATVTIALVALYAAVKGMIAVYDFLRDKTKEYVEKQSDIIGKARQDAVENTRLSRRLDDSLTDEKQLGGERGLLPEERRRRMADIMDARSATLKDIGMKNPGLLGQNGIVFDSFGRAVGATEGALRRLQVALDEVTKGNGLKAIKDSEVEAANAMREVSLTAGGVDGFFNIMKAKSSFLSSREVATSGGPFGFLRNLKGRLISSGNDNIANIGTDAEGLARLTDPKGGLFKDKYNKVPFFGKDNTALAKDSIQLLQAIDQQSAQFMATYGANAKKAGDTAYEKFVSENKSKLKGAVLNTQADRAYEAGAADFFRQKISGIAKKNNIYDPNLVELLIPMLRAEITGGSTRGPSYKPGKGARALLSDFGVTRIDFELNKSLVSNSRNYKAFGGDVRYAENALAAYKQALTDTMNATDKAEGPQEELGMKLRSIQIDDLKEKKAALLKQGKPGELQAIAIQQQINDLEAKQGIIEGNLNDERSRGKKILEEMVATLQNIVDLQQILRSPIQSTISNLPSSIENLILDPRKFQQADKPYLEAQQGRADELAQRDLDAINRQQAIAGPAANSASFDLQRRNVEVRRQNAQMHLEEQMQAKKDELAASYTKNNPVNQLLGGIGSSFVNKASENITNSFIEKLAENIPKIDGINLFGQDNPQVNALNQNTSALLALTQALQGSALAGAGSVGSGASSLLGGMGSLPNVGLGSSLASGAAGITLLGAGGAATAMKFKPGSAEEAMAGLDSNLAGLGQVAGTTPQLVSAKVPQQNASMAKFGTALAGALAGAGFGSTVTQARGKEGYGGAIGGALGGILGSTAGAAFGGTIWGPLLGGLLGSFFDKDKSFTPPKLDKLEEIDEQIVYELQKIEKKLNTINDTMSNIINAPANFVLPIPKGVLENSVTAQSAIATPLQAGGLILKSGPAFLHAGETVVSKNAMSSGGAMSVTNSITIQGANKDPQEIANEVMNRLNASMNSQSQRTGSYRGRF